MKRLLTILLAAAFSGCMPNYPDVIHIDGGRLHVQGIALDKKSELL